MSDLKIYTKGARVWIKDPECVWKAARVTVDYDGDQLQLEAEDDASTLCLEIGKKGQELPPLRNPDILIGENDLTNLSYLHEPAVLHNLAVRFLDNQAIYTYCGIVLVAINPYQELPIYGNEHISMYRGKNMGDLDPHIYAVSEEAFTKMERENRNQSIIVSGESGAGKTVSAKYAMRYFAMVGGTSETETTVEKRVLASSPIMEAIGNAKTTRNDNSSRFGKYIEIDFNKHFHIIGASMRTYLLEKSRVVFQASYERNYHIFYQMCAARDSAPELKEFNLDSPMKFEYTSQGGDPEIDGVDDLKEFNYTKEAFRLLKFSDKEQINIFRILAGILHLGNVKFESGSGRADSESCSIRSSDESLHNFAQLFEIEEDQMKKWLCNRKIVTTRETYTKPIGAESAQFARDALAKFIYSKIFDWIVVQINKALKPSSKVHKFIGVLDIYGFETFDINSFEQFCINYANEKLQQQFNQHVFKLEQDEYLKEGIEWKMIDFYDNQPCIDLIETKLGILDLLDEECRMPKGSDKSWVEKLYDKCSKCDHFAKPRLSQTAFIVKHFADDVEYECHGFLDKNRDTINEEQINILCASGNDLVSELFLVINALDTSKSHSKPGTGGSRQSLSKQNKKTVGSQFRDSLTQLMAALNSTTPHYVRCIKPNDDKAAFEFDPRRGVQQLRACGVLETVRISAAGYPSRWTYYDFFVRYRVLCHSKHIKRSDFRSTCENIVTKLISDEDKYQFGKTKLFFRAGQVAYMEKLRSEKLRDCGIMIQKHVKGWLYRKKFQSIQTATLTLQRWVRGFLARRRTRHMRRTKAAITLQKYIRGWVKRSQYQRTKDRAIRLQARIRGYHARKRHQELVRNAKAVIIQTQVRGWLARLKYLKSIRNVIMVQCQIRKFLAKRRLKKLKIQAKSMDHQKKLNQGLENKVISLQQKLTQSEKVNKEFKAAQAGKEAVIKEVEALRASNKLGKAAVAKVTSLEERVKILEEQLEAEKDEKVDLITQRKTEFESWNEKESEFKITIEDLTRKMSRIEEEFQTKGKEASEEQLRNIENERDSLKNECDQERIAYQKLLKAYNKLEAQFENTMDELNSYKNPNDGYDSFASSMLSVVDPEDESAYGGSVSGRSSMRSSGVPEKKSSSSDEHVDIGLTVRLQHKLKQTTLAKEKLEKKIEQLEQGGNQPEQRQNSDAIRLQEFEIENGRLRHDCKRLRETNNNDQVKEINEQFDNLQEELERRREECIQLRTILANVSLDNEPMSSFSKNGDELPEAEELFAAYQTQKVVIAQIQEQLNDEKARSSEIEMELREELDSLAKTCSDQQQLIHQAINKSPANNTEACLQHEITRLTSENFDLREKIENLNDNTRRLKKMLRAYMKKLEDAGVENLADITTAADTQYDQVQNSSIVIRMKDSDCLGMFEYKKDFEQKILKSLIYDLKPKIALQMLPGLPAYILFMMVRYTDHINNDTYVRSLIQGAINTIKKAVKKKGANDLDMKALWLSNILRFSNNLMQYSGEEDFNKFSTPKQVEQCLRSFDLSEYRRVITDVAIWIYQGVTKLMEEEIQPLLVPAIIEHEGIGGISGDKPGRPRGSTSEATDGVYVDPSEALNKLLHLLSRFNSIFTKHGLDPMLITRIFKETFYFICAGSLNNLLLRKDMCHWSRGMQIRYNVAQLEQWARDEKIHDQDRSPALDALNPIIQASQLLQARKNEEDVQAICDMCDTLKVSQILKILNLYTPADEFEERVTPSFVRKIQAKLADRASTENNQELLLPIKMNTAVKFSFSPSNIQLEELDIPEFYNDVKTLLKKI